MVLNTYFKLINRIVVITLLFLHFVIKESFYISSIFFYALPLPIIILAIFVFSYFIKKRVYNLILVAILLIIWLGRSFKINYYNDIKEPCLKIAFWNASHDRNFDDAFKVSQNIPDVLVLVEMNNVDFKKLKSKYPNYYFYKSSREIGVFSKLVIEEIKEEQSKNKSTIISFKTSGLNFYAVDVSANIRIPRKLELDFINDLISENKKTIILGDFNLPFESKYLKEIKNNFNHSFNEKGNGFRETWFFNLPILSLDYIWVSKDLKILKSEKINTFRSDHAMLKTSIEK